MGNKTSKPSSEEREERSASSVPSDAAPKRDDVINSYSSITTSRALLLQHLTTWIQCQNGPSKREIAERIEQQWLAEYRAFLTPGAQSHLHPDGLALMVALYFPFHASVNTKYGKLNKNAPDLSNVQEKEISDGRARWNSDAAGWINAERNGRQKSQDVYKWEIVQREEFQKWTDPTKDSCLESHQVAFLQAIGFPLNGSGESVGTTKKKRPRRNSTGGAASKKSKKNTVSLRARAIAPSTPSR